MESVAGDGSPWSMIYTHFSPKPMHENSLIPVYESKSDRIQGESWDVCEWHTDQSTWLVHTILFYFM